MRTEFGRRGSALLMTLLVLLVVSIIGLALADLIANGRQTTKNREQAFRALQVAQAGLALAKRELAHDAAWPGGAAIAFGDGETMNVEVTVVDATHRRVLSTGRLEGGERAVEALLSLGDPGLVGDESTVSAGWRER